VDEWSDRIRFDPPETISPQIEPALRRLENIVPGNFSVTPVTFPFNLCIINTEGAKERDMSKNHYVTKTKRRNRSGKRKDTKRIAANMAKIKELEKRSGRKA
jgi:hypothetical protein